MTNVPRLRRARKRRATSGVLAAYVHELSERHGDRRRERPERHPRVLRPVPQHGT